MKFDHSHIKFTESGWLIGGTFKNVFESFDYARIYAEAIDKILLEGECDQVQCFTGWRMLHFNDALIFYYTPHTSSHYNSALDAISKSTEKYKFNVKILSSDRMSSSETFAKLQFMIEDRELIKVFSDAEIASYNLNII